MKKKKPKKYKEYNFKTKPFIAREDEVKPYGPRPFKSKDLKERMDEWQQKFNDYFTGLQENGKQLKELREQQKENGKQLIELREQQKETRQQLKEASELQKRTARTLSNLGLNIGDVAEDYFIGALKSRTELASMRYDNVKTNEEKGNGKRGEYDILLLNHETVIVVEVKHKLWKWHVDDFHNRRLSGFKELFPEYTDRMLFGALAGLTVHKEARARAVELGYLVLTQSGQQVKVLNPEGFEPTVF